MLERFFSKRQLLLSKKEDKSKKHVNDDENNSDKMYKLRRMKSSEGRTDPLIIIEAHDRSLRKPRVGWQFHYRISHYINSLRGDIREDQERLNLGLQTIKHRTPQELNDRRKHISDQVFASSSNKLKQEN